MEDELITLETAIMAKDLGFNEKCRMFYKVVDPYILYVTRSRQYVGNGLSEDIEEPHRNSQKEDAKIPRYAAPTQSLLSRWIRENHNIVCSVYSNASGYIWEIHYDKTRGGTHIKDSDMRGDCKSSGTFTTYELAMEDCLSETLRGLKYGKF